MRNWLGTGAQGVHLESHEQGETVCSGRVQEGGQEGWEDKMLVREAGEGMSGLWKCGRVARQH